MERHDVLTFNRLLDEALRDNLLPRSNHDSVRVDGLENFWNDAAIFVLICHVLLLRNIRDIVNVRDLAIPLLEILTHALIYEPGWRVVHEPTAGLLSDGLLIHRTDVDGQILL